MPTGPKAITAARAGSHIRQIVRQRFFLPVDYPLIEVILLPFSIFIPLYSPEITSDNKFLPYMTIETAFPISAGSR
jgi:hypothetical protein